MDNSWLSGFIQLSLFAFVFMMAIGMSRMALRAIRLREAGLPLGPILKRDLAFWAALFVLFGGGRALSQIFGPLSNNPLWIVPVTLFVLGSVFYWVWVEWHLEEAEDELSGTSGNKGPGQEDSRGPAI